MTPLVTRLLLAALAGTSILLARLALERQARAQAANDWINEPAAGARQWVEVGPVARPRARMRPGALSTFYQVRWLGPASEVRPAGSR
ncbi:hypothetical protein HHL22_18800 [Hymenobacter sp. RP-2-7]|uniref:Uncharacterized protein n=1 Tax=Hymenobacter polaris TaxID=2682546 RepID=A0A7Y0FNT4_9BACT|nr:hypothetical protein [Hymenobacter polaris]NML67258.1 hypothetical protein [Hymenobacter polaris]